MNEKKKDNAFVRWTEKHAEIWKFIKFMIAGGFWDMVIKLIGMAIPTLWTYPCNRFIIHRKKKPQTTATEKEEA